MKMNESGCCCVFADDGETILKYCLAHKVALDAARREMRERRATVANKCYPDGWKVAIAIRALPDEPGDN